MGKRQCSLKDISSFYVYIKSDITRMAEITLPHSPDKGRCYRVLEHPFDD